MLLVSILSYTDVLWIKKTQSLDKPENSCLVWFRRDKGQIVPCFRLRNNPVVEFGGFTVGAHGHCYNDYMFCKLPKRVEKK